MKRLFKKAYVVIPLVLLLVVMAASVIFVTNADAASTPWKGITTGSANVRTGPTTRASSAGTDKAGISITVYATVSGQVVWGGISAWYRVSSLNLAPRYIYGGLVKRVTTTSSAPSPQSYLIVVSLSQQSLHAYLNGKDVYTTLVTTGMPELSTPTGTWHVTQKLSNVTFTSMWPTSSPFYYSPEHVNYALDYDGQIYLHDATWRSVFGPGTDVPHDDPQFGQETGSHGCVNLPLAAAQWLYNWAPVGTTVQVVN